MTTKQSGLFKTHTHYQGYEITAHHEIKAVVFQVAHHGRNGKQIGIFEVLVPISEVALFWDNHPCVSIPQVVWQDGTRSWCTAYTMIEGDFNRPHHISSLSGMEMVRVNKLP